MTTKSIPLTFLTLAGSLIVAHGQTNAPAVSASAQAPAPELSPLEKSIQDIKHPVSWLTWGAELRLRNEYYNNAVTHDSSAPRHEEDYFRYRGRIWTAISPIEDLTLNARLSAEPREYLNGSDSGVFLKKTGMLWNYGILDILNVQWRNVISQPLTITVGRQEIFLDDNWLTGDGTPLDGSWTAFTDAARLTYDFKEQHTTIDVIGILQNARADAWLPIIDSQNRGLTDQNEQGAILNVSNKSIKEANVDGYFMYKGDQRVTDNPPGGLRGDNADIYTIGGRLSGLCADHWKYSSEGAYQFGEKQDPFLVDPTPGQGDVNGTFRDISAFGFNNRVGYLFNDAWKNQVSVSYEFLSGDKPGTSNDEMFDVLWGRYPRWSDLVNIQGNITETRVGQIGNLHRVGPTWNFIPVKDLDVTASYYALFADQALDTRLLPSNKHLYTGDGSFRGHLVTTYLRYKFNPHVSTLLQGEVLFPGNFYTSKAMESFLRAELNFTF